MRVLIVDDSTMLQRLYKALLAKRGHQVLAAFSAEEARRLLAEATAAAFDLALLDIWLDAGEASPPANAAPGRKGEGYALLAEIRANPKLASLVVVAVTGDGSPEDVRSFEQAGFDDHLKKPVDPQTFVDQVERFAAKVRAR